MAYSVAMKGQNRALLIPEAQALLDRLKLIAKDLRTHIPETKGNRSEQISESLLDLKYVLGMGKGMSLRLHQALKAEKLWNE